MGSEGSVRVLLRTGKGLKGLVWSSPRKVARRRRARSAPGRTEGRGQGGGAAAPRRAGKGAARGVRRGTVTGRGGGGMQGRSG